MASPNVVSRGIRGPERRLRSSIARCSTYPIARATGRTSAVATNGEMAVWWTTVQMRKAPSTAMLRKLAAGCDAHDAGVGALVFPDDRVDDAHDPRFQRLMRNVLELLGGAHNHFS